MVLLAAAVVVLCLFSHHVSNGPATALLSDQPGYITPKQGVEYYYVPSSAIKAHQLQLDLHGSTHPPQILDDRPDWLPDKKRISPFPQGSAPPNTNRTCALSSLVLQASLIFTQWSECGYLHFEHGPNFLNAGGKRHTIMVGSPNAVITAPFNDTACTLDKMDKEPCRSESVRYLARDEPDAVKTCVGRIKGLSQTCDLYTRWVLLLSLFVGICIPRLTFLLIPRKYSISLCSVASVHLRLHLRLRAPARSGAFCVREKRLAEMKKGFTETFAGLGCFFWVGGLGGSEWVWGWLVWWCLTDVDPESQVRLHYPPLSPTCSSSSTPSLRARVCLPISLFLGVPLCSLSLCLSLCLSPSP